MRKIGSISSIEIPAPPNVKNPLHIILFHGFGADAYDLQSLAEVLKPKDPATWLFPQGIREVPIGPGWTGRAWWPIDLARLEAAHRSGDYDLSTVRPQGIDELRKQVDEMIKQLGVPWNRIVLGGFSQGAMLATDTFLRAEEHPAGLILLSGALVNKEEWKPLVSRRAGCKFFQSHGRHDAVLSYRSASQLESLLTGGGLKGSLFTFEGAHEIPWPAIEKCNQWLASL